MALITALFVASTCLSVILRKQWVESERLSYPILRPVLDLTDRARPGFSSVSGSGFSVALGIISWNMIHYFVPGFPQIPNIRWGPWVLFERYFPGIWTRINMFTISFAYFANIDVLFSLWFFCVLFILRSGCSIDTATTPAASIRRRASLPGCNSADLSRLLSGDYGLRDTT